MSKEKNAENLPEKTGSNLPANIAMDMLVDAQEHSGFDTMSADDLAIPYITILQALSPQVRGESKVAGAEEGMFYNTVSGLACKGPIYVIPCAYKRAYMEWTPRESGGGYVEEHTDASILEGTKKDSKGRDILPNGNIIATTAYHYCMLLKEGGAMERAVLSFSSTQLKKARKWNSVMQNLTIATPDGQKVTPPMYSHIYSVNSVAESNDKGSWSGWSIGSPEIITNPAFYVAAKKFNIDVMKGAVKVAPKEEEAAEQSAATVESDSNIL